MALLRNHRCAAGPVWTPASAVPAAVESANERSATGSRHLIEVNDS